MSTSAFLQALIPLYLMATIGYFGRKLNILPKSSNEVMTQLLLYVTLPSLILYSLDTTFSKALLKEFFWLVGMSFYSLIVSSFLQHGYKKELHFLKTNVAHTRA